MLEPFGCLWNTNLNLLKYMLKMNRKIKINHYIINTIWLYPTPAAYMPKLVTPAMHATIQNPKFTPLLK